MTTFKLQHPQDLISRLFILEYIRELGIDTIISKLTDGEKRFWTYKFESEDREEYDFNWEYLLFVIPIGNLSHIMERYLEEIDSIETSRQEFINKQKEELIQEKLSTPVDMNLMDFAKAQIDQSKDASLLHYGSDRGILQGGRI